MHDVFDLTAAIVSKSLEEKNKAAEEKKTLREKLETASGEEVFKIMNLISFSNMDEFTAEARLHAQQSFRICMFSAISGFLIICVSVGFAIYFQLAGIEGLSSAYLGAVVGLITEAISAIFFSLYSKTTRQVNRLHDRLLGSQSAYSAVLVTSMLVDASERNAQLISLSNKMMARLEGLDRVS
ncbi:TRADD-N-associated membrane domain-containing protein [Rhodospirillum sp. A1_3_36]|uniref:TRADD-N-associated membrane domain-containing protein n=1 Tax=Rhodospirillum sp. A1_3_36 TaxID=3391666 RepID=UPI0039A54623